MHSRNTSVRGWLTLMSSLALPACGGESSSGDTSDGSDSGGNSASVTSGGGSGAGGSGGNGGAATGGALNTSSTTMSTVDSSSGGSASGATVVGDTATAGGSAGTGAATSSGGSGGAAGSGGTTSSTGGSGNTTTTTGAGGTGVTPPDLDWQCDGTPCVPGAACDESTSNCECAEGYQGDGWWCLSTEACTDSPCQNGGTCHPTIGDRVLCTCPQGFGGVHCELACSGEIAFPDAALEAAVRSAALLDAAEPITAEVLADVRSLSIYDTPISNLTGLECMSALSWVTMYNVGLTDLTAFAALPRLTSLQVDCNPFTDISPIASLINLIQFNAGKSSSCEVPGQITDISPLQDLVGLTDLDLSGHDIASLASLEPLTHLETLILASNANLTSLAGIDNAAYLEYFVATDTQVSDVSLFANHAALQTLWLSGSQVSDLTPLLSASVLEDLYIRATAVDCTAQADNISALAANGVTVSSDCD